MLTLFPTNFIFPTNYGVDIILGINKIY